MPITRPSTLLPALQEFLAATRAEQIVTEISRRLDYSTAIGRELLAEHYKAVAVVKNPASGSDALIWSRAVVDATHTEINRRVERNFANRYFGLFLLAVRTGNAQLESESYQHLRQFGFGILKKEWPGYSHHFDHPTVWIERIGEVLLTELQRHAHLQPLEIWERIFDNRFAYLYRALYRQFQDEWRNFYRHLGREVQLDESHGYETSAISDGERESTARELEEEAARREQGNPGHAAVLRQCAAFYRDPEGWQASYGDFLKPGSLSKAVKEARGVCLRTAQRNIEAVKEEAKANEELQAIRTKLKDAVERAGACVAVSLSLPPERTNDIGREAVERVGPERDTYPYGHQSLGTTSFQHRRTLRTRTNHDISRTGARAAGRRTHAARATTIRTIRRHHK